MKTASRVRLLIVGLSFVLAAALAPLSVTESASAAGSQFYMATPHLCGWQWASFIHSAGYVNDIGENWALSDPYLCRQGVNYPTGWLNTREDIFTGIYGGPINICIFGTAQSNPYYGAAYLAREDLVQGYDCGPNWYFAVNQSNMQTFGGWTSGQLTHDLQQ